MEKTIPVYGSYTNAARGQKGCVWQGNVAQPSLIIIDIGTRSHVGDAHCGVPMATYIVIVSLYSHLSGFCSCSPGETSIDLDVQRPMLPEYNQPMTGAGPSS